MLGSDPSDSGSNPLERAIYMRHERFKYDENHGLTILWWLLLPLVGVWVLLWLVQHV